MSDVDDGAGLTETEAPGEADDAVIDSEEDDNPDGAEDNTVDSIEERTMADTDDGVSQ